MTETFLEITDLHKAFGGLVALNRVTTRIQEGTLKAIIGPNGAGKTTAFNIVSGLISSDSGEVKFRGKRIKSLAPQDIARLGIARTFQHSRTYGELTVLENVLMASAASIQHHFLESCLAGSRSLSGLKGLVPNAERRALEMLEFVGLWDRRHESAGILSYGEQKYLGLARALSLDPTPSLLLLDEPTAGLNSEEVQSFMEHLRELRKKSITIVMVEHRLQLVADVSDEVMVLDFGEVIADGPTDAVWADSRVIEAYLGSGPGCETVEGTS